MDGFFLVNFADGATMEVPSATFARGRPKPNDYLIRYADGYLSWSPARAFEAGYRPLPSLRERALQGLADTLTALKQAPPSREVSIAITQTETAMLWVQAAMKEDGR
jgi:hypothetical protein